MELHKILGNTDKSKIKDQEINVSSSSIIHSESGTAFGITDSARRSLDSFKGEQEHKKVLVLEEMIDKVFSSVSDSTEETMQKKKFELLRDSIVHNDKIGENALWDILRRESSQALVQEGLHTIKDLCESLEPPQQNLDQSSSDYIVSSEEHLHALVDAVIASKSPGGKKFSSSGFLQDIGVAMSDQKKLHVVIQDHDHNTWKKHLDNVKNIDSDVRTKVYGTLVNLEEKHVKARK